MGTKGYICIQYNKKYHCVYKSHGSDPECLGEILVKLLKLRPVEDTEEYKDYIIKDFVSENTPEIIEDCLSDIDEIDQKDSWISWIYVIDITTKTFTVIDHNHRNLEKDCQHKFDIDSLDYRWKEHLYAEFYYQVLDRE